MADSDAEEQAVQPSMLARAEEIQRQIQQLSGRDLQLWSIGALVILVLTGGLLAILLPNVMWAQRVIRLEHSYLPQLFFGLISLILLFNIYLLGQKLTLNATRHALIRELVLNERLENLSLIDPLTQMLNRRAVNELVPIEVSRANRLGGNLTFMAIDLDGFRAVNARYGLIEGDHLLLEFAKILRTVFRGGDMVFRHGGDEFLVVMPETSEPQADYPVERLLRGVEQWNLTHKKSYQMAFSYGVSAYVTGADYADALRAVDRKMYQKRHNLVPVF
ncbi:MAG TPA: GGDEF domain-containing protein [Terriglobales bacterium]|nr:GGDEF domain-containing protein [Terriglobales bacterium]